MLGIITLFVALGAQVAFLVFRMTTGNWQSKAAHFARITAFITFSLLTVTGIYWWGFRWMGLFLLLAVLAVFSVLHFAGRSKKEKRYRGLRVVFSCIGGCLLASFCILPGILFPQFKEVVPTGSLGVDTQSVTLVDKSRVDPFSHSGENRRLTVQFWYPSVAGNTGAFPLVVFSHGAFGFRGSNLSTFKNLASNGYVVCSIDHSHHSFYARHMDGSGTPVNWDFLNDAVNITNGAYDGSAAYGKTHEWLALRAADMNFVLDEILNDRLGKIPQDVSSKIDADKIGLFGHSLGGATAAQLGRERPGVGAVAVLDGTMFGEEVSFENGNAVLNENPYPVPLLNLYSESHYDDAHEQGLSYDNLSASAHAAQAYDVVIHGSGHLNFTDLPLFSPALAHMLGTGQVDSRYCIETMNQIVLEFFNHTLKGGAGLHLQPEY
ncbi:alpha/beta hydrolase family protein [Bacillota bacterium Meth-B3]